MLKLHVDGVLSIFVGTPDDDAIGGTDGRDTIDGAAGDDRLFGFSDPDLLWGGEGRDELFGGEGNDALDGGDGGGDGLDPDAAGKEYDPPLEQTEQLYGGAGNDWIDGGAGEESIFGDDGNDLLQSGAGHDYIVGGAGDDLIYGDAGLDQMYGGDGGDLIVDRLNAPNADHGEGLNGEAGDDLLIGSDSWNVLTGGSGADVIMGGGQNDVLAGGDAIYETVDGQVTLVAGTHDGSIDRFVFRDGDGHDSIYGFETGPGGDVLDLSRLGNTATRGDLYIAATGSGTVIGFDADNSVLLVGVTDPILLTDANFIFRSPETEYPEPTPWADYATASAGVAAGLEAGELFRGRTDGIVAYGAANMRGSAFDDVLAGDSGANVIDGGDGDDVLEGRDGDDILIGGGRADILSGGAGIDRAVYADAGTAMVVSLAAGLAAERADDGDVAFGIGTGGGADLVAAVAAAWRAGPPDNGDFLIGIEEVSGSAFDDILHGNDGANMLAGRAGSDQLFGDGGDDVLIGGAGGDALYGGAGTDTASYAGSAAGVVANLRNGVNRDGDAAGDVLTDIENLIGSSFADTLVGDAGDNLLEGGAGGDILNGWTGNDTATYAGSSAGVVANLRNGIGLGGDAEGDWLTNIENLTGSSFADTLVGDAGDNLLDGRAGGDVLNGWTGNDTATYAGSNAGVVANLRNGIGLGGDAEGDRLTNIENLTGSSFADTLVGDAGDNFLDGGAGDDELIGGAGADTLTGGSGADLFVFREIADSPLSDWDILTDFGAAEGDRIDLSAIDANAGAAGDQAFTFIGARGFDGQAGQLRFNGTLLGDIDGDGRVDLRIELAGGAGIAAADIFL